MTPILLASSTLLANSPPGPVTHLALIIAAALLGLSVLLGVWRAWKGPGLPDRVVALDLLGTLCVGACVLISILTSQTEYLLVAMVMALVLFVSTLAAAHYLTASKGDGVSAPRTHHREDR